MGTLSASRVEELMSAYLDGEISPEDAQALEGHLREQPETHAELEALRRTKALVAGLPRPVAPVDFYEQVARGLRRRARTDPAAWLLTLAIPLQVISIVVILVVATIYMLMQLEQVPAGKLQRDLSVSPSDDSEVTQSQPPTP